MPFRRGKVSQEFFILLNLDFYVMLQLFQHLVDKTLKIWKLQDRVRMWFQCHYDVIGTSEILHFVQNDREYFNTPDLPTPDN